MVEIGTTVGGGLRNSFVRGSVESVLVEFRSAMSPEARHLIGTQLALLFDRRVASLPLQHVELLARLCVAEAMVAFDRDRSLR
jgi:hypothetical protein